ncbi:ABC transporter substrate-binding protein [Paenibacillus senegalensis]|uniref:ABC transporter substrate-binding protein n=1 Tax=Paenibacillus senegalensis TaxID=1465766 RepID=UPI000287F6B1|nr:extracellular solute-binding protein [Paenibacillus senegalensis]
MMPKYGMSRAMLVLFMALLTACGGGSTIEPSSDPAPTSQVEETNSPEPDKNEPKDPVKLILHNGSAGEEEFYERFGAMLQEKFPHVTIEFIRNGTGTTIQDLITQGTIPDIIRTDMPTIMSGYLDLELGEDMMPYVEKYNYDLSRFNEVFIEEMLAIGQNGELYGLPVGPYFPQVLYYNKDLFDKFGVDYPTDGMTWDEVYELARTMTREEDGVEYRGFSTNPAAVLRDNPLSLPILDPHEDGLADMEQWRALFQNLLRFYQIPGNPIGDDNSKESLAFSGGNVAMQINQHSVYLTIPPEINWDIAAYPLMEGAPEVMAQRGPAYYSLTSQSKHKELAFEIIMEMLSDEIQMEDSKRGIPTTLNNEAIKKELGTGHPIYSGKNMGAINVYPPVSYAPKRERDKVEVAGIRQQVILYETFVELAQGAITDVNTALNKVDELLKQEIENRKQGLN